MISRLCAQHFAIIDQLDLQFPNGFIAITGETGAGKSILFDAISLCLGGRASTDLIRHGEDKATLELELRLRPEQRTRILPIVEEEDIDLEDTLLIKRVIATNGRHRIYLNGQRVSLGVLTSISKGLVDIIGQHASHALLSTDSHIEILDNFAGISKDTQALSSKVDRLRTLQREVSELLDQEEIRQLKMSRVQTQLDDIEMAQIEVGEDERLQKEIDRLLNAETLREHTQEVAQRLSGGDGSVVDQLTLSLQVLQRVADLDDQFEEMLDVLAKSKIELDEMARDVGRISDSVTVSPEELEIMQERLHLIERLKRTHGGDVESVIRARDHLQVEMDTLLGQQSRIGQAQAEMDALVEECLADSVSLSHIRQEASKRMAILVESELSQLGMPHCRFRVNFEHRNATGLVESVEQASIEGITRTGLDAVEYVISPNPGEGFQPMAKIASGGELSRILLSLKVALIQSDPVGTYIFDEVDTGIGGGVAQTVGQKLQQVGDGRQVLCISHLPQVISCAHHHLHVRKQVVDNRTSSATRYLSFGERSDEVARMLGGIEITERTREHAMEMLRLNQPKVTHLNPALGSQAS